MKYLLLYCYVGKKQAKNLFQQLPALPRRELQPLSTVLSTLLSTLNRRSIMTAAKSHPVIQMPGMCAYMCVCVVCVCVCVCVCTSEPISLTGMSSTRRSSGEGVLMLLEITSLLRSWRNMDPPCLHLLLKETKVNKQREQLLWLLLPLQLVLLLLWQPLGVGTQRSKFKLRLQMLYVSLWNKYSFILKWPLVLGHGWWCWWWWWWWWRLTQQHLAASSFIPSEFESVTLILTDQYTVCVCVCVNIKLLMACV